MLQFFTGNIGLHHVHHLSARIPNYNLQRAHDENQIFHDVPTLSLLAFTSGVSANSICFERELLDHYRLVFEKTRVARAGE